jgi:hypothetical protein
MRKVHRAQQKAALRALGLPRLSRHERAQAVLGSAFVAYPYADLSGARFIAIPEPSYPATEPLDDSADPCPSRALPRSPLGAARTQDYHSDTGNLSHGETRYRD